jgi:hypothetical protein
MNKSILSVLALGMLAGVGGALVACSSTPASTPAADAGTVDAADAARRNEAGGGGDGSTGPVACLDESEAGIYQTPAAKGAQGKCTPAQITGYLTACLSASATEASCDAYYAQSADCAKCIDGPVQGDNPANFFEPVLIYSGESLFSNTSLCGGIVAGDLACAKKLSNEEVCAFGVCGECDEADFGTCADQALAGVCKEFEAGKACRDLLTAKKAEIDMKCVGADFDSEFVKVAGVVCGAP